MSSTTAIVSVGEPWMWAAFVAFVLLMLALDLFVFGGRTAHRVSIREAALWSAAWIGLALLFNLGLWWHLTDTVGPEIANRKALEFLTGYLIEKSLSVDNVFVFLLIFSSFHVAAEYQRRVLIYGVVGAIAMRTVMILAGAWVVREFAWVLYLFGLLLVVTGIRMLVMAERTPDLEKNPVLRFARRHLRISDDHHGEKFIVVKNGVRYFTPLFLVLILIEASDLVFAVDSIPAIFAITTDPFIVFTSNIFAILGLRALYFLIADVASRFHLLKYGLAMVLTFIGTKMLIAPWYHVPVQASLAIVAVLIGASVVASLIATREPAQGK
ncbi:MAG TPA: TerC family protein [Pseudomonadales bacterium]|jgi:tellurite resistance protein TerC|nr:TerC family protein [Pseudomonadales bacterium]HMW15586.1 TerC family protein [Pseudomonadales bacterium]HMW83674.1 TerC family protein [Pseudomonadales bacterium]HMY97596.1 TerC family protein [Pseudomonadales bacterium]HMZ71413.1 TerC family protein [Pseudomonadales bacterium]